MGSEMCIRDSRRRVSPLADLSSASLSSASPVSAVTAPTPSDIACSQLRNKEEMQKYYSESSLQLKLFPSSPEVGALPVLCDVSLGPDRRRPVIPRHLVPTVLADFHGISHGGGKATLRLVRARFVWSRMSSDCLAFVRNKCCCFTTQLFFHFS